MRQLFFPTILLLTMQLSVSARPIGSFPETATPEVAPCYFKTSDGRAFDLSRMCGKSEPLSRARKQTQQNSPTTVNAALSNPDFRVVGNANPGSPFGNNSRLAQCYVVDAEGNPCQP